MVAPREEKGEGSRLFDPWGDGTTDKALKTFKAANDEARAEARGIGSALPCARENLLSPHRQEGRCNCFPSCSSPIHSGSGEQSLRWTRRGYEHTSSVHRHFAARLEELAKALRLQPRCFLPRGRGGSEREDSPTATRRSDT